MPSLADQRCLIHETREAVARCPACGNFFCRECVTEHEERLLCAGCLTKLARQASARRWRFAALWPVGQCLLGFFVAWLFLYGLGKALLLTPSSFHEGTLWQGTWREER